MAMTEQGTYEPLAAFVDVLGNVPEGSGEDGAFARLHAVAREEASELAAVASTSAQDVEVAFVGYLRSGKTTLVQALIGRQLLPSRHDATTLVTTRVTYRSTGYASRLVFIDAQDLECERLELEAALREGRSCEEFVRALASVGALREGDTGPCADPRRLEGLRADLGEGLGLPAVPLHLQKLLGSVRARAHASEAALVEAVATIIAPEPGHGGSGELGLDEHALLAEVVLTGPFESLRALLPQGVDRTRLSLLDVPGLGDARAYVGRRVREALRRADVVSINVGNHGNPGEEDVKLVRDLTAAGRVRSLLFTIGKFDLICSADGGSPDEHIARTRRHIRQVVAEASASAKVEQGAEDVPVVPVVARASLLRQLAEGGAPPGVSRTDGRLLEDYPDDASTGLDELRGHVRRMLDPEARKRRVEAVLDDCARGALARVLATLDETVEETRRLCDLSRTAHERLSKETRSIATAIAEAGVSIKLAARLRQVIVDFVNARGQREPDINGTLCAYKCCGEPAAFAPFSYREIVHASCAAHRGEVEAIHHEAKMREMRERPECTRELSCTKPQLPGKSWCADHAPPICGVPGCVEVATSDGKCEFHAREASPPTPPASSGFDAASYLRSIAATLSSYDDDDLDDDDSDLDDFDVFEDEVCGAETSWGGLCTRPPPPGYKRCWQHRGRRR